MPSELSRSRWCSPTQYKLYKLEPGFVELEGAEAITRLPQARLSDFKLDSTEQPQSPLLPVDTPSQAGQSTSERARQDPHPPHHQLRPAAHCAEHSARPPAVAVAAPAQYPLPHQYPPQQLRLAARWAEPSACPPAAAAAAVPAASQYPLPQQDPLYQLRLAARCDEPSARPPAAAAAKTRSATRTLRIS